MWRIIRLVFLGYWHDKPVHQHKWVKIEKFEKSVKTIYGDVTRKSMLYVLQCSECGEIKYTEIS